jgi:phytoene synthase
VSADTEAADITRASKSNLALAFISLPKERRADITLFYAWCRVIDDLADDPGVAIEHRRLGLDRWKEALREPVASESNLAPAVRALIAKYRLPLAHFLDVIAGVEMDLAGVRYETWEDLRLYCYRVASAVGLISIEIFGCRDLRSREYAEELGLALQITNILRDVGEDWRNGGRIYLPSEDLARFGYTPEDLAAGERNDAFLALMRFEAGRAREHYARAIAAMPATDRHALIAAEIMRAVYTRLLGRMERDEFQIFRQRYQLSRWEKLRIVLGTVLRSKFA